MDKNIELYIKTGIDTDTTTFPFERLELYDFEDINITSKIQDIRDISKIFTDYSREFSVPASRSNNKVFKHYYNWYIDNGFDARFKVDGILKIDGIDYKKGKISLLGVAMKDNAPLSYKIVFYGETVSLKDIFGDDELKDLGYKANNTSTPTVLDKYKFSFDVDFVKDGLRYGWVWDEVNQELRNPQNTVAVDSQNLCFPFISAKNYYFYDSDIESGSPVQGSTESRNLKYDGTTTNTSDNVPRGLNYLDLKPALRLDLITQAIEERYGLEFDRSGFFDTSNSDYYNLFMWLNRESGSIDNQLSSSSKLYNLSDFTAFGSPTWTGDTDIDDINITPSKGYEVDIIITPDGSSDTADYTVRIPSIASGISFQQTSSGTQTITVDYKPEVSNPYAPALGYGSYQLDIYLETLSSAFTGWSIDVVLRKYTGSAGNWTLDSLYNFNELNLQTFPIGGADIVRVESQMPKMKVMDYLTSIFKMFNLTAYFENGKIFVETLDDYYASGVEYDISKYVDNSSGNVDRAKLYSEVNLEFEDAKTFAITKSNEITGDDFGNERLSNLFASLQLRDLLAFDGGSYDVKPKFERMMFERMTAQDTELKTDVQWGWSVNEDQNPVLTKPVLFYPEEDSLGLATNPPYTIAFDENPQKDNFDDYLASWSRLNQTEINQYIKPTNINADTNNSIHFGSEFDEFTGAYNGNSLTFNYWTRYVLSIYDKRSRVVKTKAYLPSHLITDIELKDIVIINGVKYRINSMDINLNKAEVKLELFNDLGYYD